ncbi:MAG: hypothetical protein HC811_02595 [Flammeovirgaceae bacterium]|nr:hypothetical protein [Flammeovirgaceae bacterium]
MPKKKKNKALLYFLTSAVMLAGAALMKSFPVFVFAGLAPLFAITDHVKDNDRSWIYSELILLSVSFSFFALTFFSFTSLPWIIGQGILLTLCFTLYIFSREQLGEKLPLFIVLIFWLGVEYLLLKLTPLHDFIYLADFLQLKSAWFTWSQYTGYLGASCWILLCNFIFYQAVFKKELNWTYVFIFSLLVIIPIGLSYFNDYDPVLRKEMISLYTENASINSGTYSSRGELIPRTAAWVGALIVLFSLVKFVTGRKK